MYPSTSRVPRLIAYTEVEGHHKHQLAVVHRLEKLLKNRLDKILSSSGEPKAISVAKLDLEEAAELIEKIENRTAEINDLQSAATRSHDQVCVSLSSKLLGLIC